MVIRQRQQPVSDNLKQAFSPLLSRVLANRGIIDPRQVDYSLKGLVPYNDLKGLPEAVSLLEQAVVSAQRIMVVGDFDCDGATSTALCLLALQAMGARHTDYLVPNRFTQGYGLSSAIVDLASQHQPDLIITVDNGIASHSGVERAHQYGIKVLVTDHHLPGNSLPLADAIINPNQPGCKFAFKSTAGVGVIFYVLLALRRQLQERGWFKQQGILQPNLAQYLDLVALGTVADLVPLERNNRILVAQGLARLRQGQGRPGLLALLTIARRNYATLTAADLAFATGPRLNAAGRLDDMSLGIECLLTESEAEAQALAQRLDQLNHERRRIETDMQQQAQAFMNTLQDQDDQVMPKCVCLYQSDWHQGVIGILASRVKEKYHRPVVILADGEDGLLKGSARSVSGFHIRDAIAAIDTAHPGLIECFGGHAMAAGLSLHKEALPRFQQALLDYAEQHLDAEHLAMEWFTDGELEVGDLLLSQAEALQQLGPWGQAFPEPCFHGQFELVQQRLVQDKHLKLVLAEPTSGALVDAIYFNADLQRWPSDSQLAQLVYRLDVNEFRGQRNLQLLVQYMQPL
jgi:single-stranded-DNA-specific exonuclease